MVEVLILNVDENGMLRDEEGGSSIRSRQGLECGSEVPQRRHEVAPDGSDVIRATRLSRSHIRCPELESRSGSDVPQRPREVARVPVAGSDVIRATRLSRSHIRVTREVARVYCDTERPIRATTPGRSRAGPGLERGSEVPQRRHEVAPAGSDVIRATGPSRSHILCPELKSHSGSDVLQRPREVARVFYRWERHDRSDSAKSLAYSVSGARESLWERRLAATT
ncbi:hypothetical protein F2Q69_00059229 [Brassica cretica]|uniref:Uncharacterized protein n=1 Tax=Brassica cretica TaxID=69181 RepID=A0A8S9RAT3_BRACR|nr:hypothetical protein F2Q69_00059229 [Brassica cretica]